MGLIYKREPFLHKPSLAESIALNRSHPQIDIASAFFTFQERAGNSTVDVKNRISGAFNGTVSWQPNHLVFPGGNTNYINAGNPSHLDITGNALYIAIKARVNSHASNKFQCLVAKGQMWTTSSGYSLGWWQDGKWYLDVYTGSTNQASFTDPNDSKWHIFEGIYDGSNIWLAIDGVDGTKVPVSGNITSSSHNFHIGRSATTDPNDVGFNGDIEWVYVSAKVPPTGVREQIRLNPWAAFERQIWVPVGTGGDPVLVAEGGSWTYAGAAANLEYGRSLSAEGGAYSLSGTDANLEYGKVIIAESSSYSVSGADANLEYGRSFVAENGAYSISGTDANLVYGAGAILVAESGSYSVSGTDANIEYGRSLSAESSSYSYSGTDASLFYNREIIPDSASYTQTGSDASLKYNRHLDAASQSYIYTGNDATLSYTPGNTLVAEPGSYVATGTDVNFLYNRVLAAELGSYLIGGNDVTLTHAGVTPTLSTGVRLISSWTAGTMSNEMKRRLKKEDDQLLNYLTQNMNEIDWGLYT